MCVFVCTVNFRKFSGIQIFLLLFSLFFSLYSHWAYVLTSGVFQQVLFYFFKKIFFFVFNFCLKTFYHNIFELTDSFLGCVHSANVPINAIFISLVVVLIS